MTKLRAPLTAQLALTRIAGLIGWDRCGQVTGKSPRTVLDWSDPDTTAGVTLDAAIILDLEYSRAGGEGFPLLELHALKLQVEQQAVEACRQQLLQNIGAAALETGQATAASLAAASTGASAADLLIAERETEESIAALTRILTQLRALQRGEDTALPGGPNDNALRTYLPALPIHRPRAVEPIGHDDLSADASRLLGRDLRRHLRRRDHDHAYHFAQRQARRSRPPAPGTSPPAFGHPDPGQRHRQAARMRTRRAALSNGGARQ